MTVYSIRADVTQFKRFLVEDEDVWATNLLQFDCTSKRDIWSPPKVWVPEPKKPTPDFWYLTSGAVVSNSRATELLRDELEWTANELLDLPYEGDHFSVTNVMLCWDCLDDVKTEYRMDRATGEKLSIKKVAFRRDRLPEAPIFKIPQTCRGEIYCTEGMIDAGPEDNCEFKFNVERHGLKGLIFDKVWEG